MYTSRLEAGKKKMPQLYLFTRQPYYQQYTHNKLRLFTITESKSNKDTIKNVLIVSWTSIR